MLHSRVRPIHHELSDPFPRPLLQLPGRLIVCLITYCKSTSSNFSFFFCQIWVIMRDFLYTSMFHFIPTLDLLIFPASQYFLIYSVIRSMCFFQGQVPPNSGKHPSFGVSLPPKNSSCWTSILKVIQWWVGITVWTFSSETRSVAADWESLLKTAVTFFVCRWPKSF